MKFCKTCGCEIDTRDGDNRCLECEEITSKKRLASARRARKLREQALRDLGLVKVRGALGGTYWE